MNVDSERLRQEFRKVVARRNQSVTPKLLDQLDGHLVESIGNAQEDPFEQASKTFDRVMLDAMASDLADGTTGIGAHIQAVAALQAAGADLSDEGAYAEALIRAERAGAPDLAAIDEDAAYEGDKLSRRLATADAVHRIATRGGAPADADSYVAAIEAAGAEHGLDFYDRR